MKTYEGILIELPKNGVFVFGSNKQGRHGAGAALAARKYFQARLGQAKGLQGKSFAICTKDLLAPKQPSVSILDIIEQIEELYEFARKHPNIDFYVAYGGTNQRYLCGYTSQQMATMWNALDRPHNIVFEKEFSTLLLL